MSEHRWEKDLLVLVADGSMKVALQGLLTRSQSLAIRPIEFDVYSHPGNDPGCRTKGVEFLRTFCKRYEHAILMFDHEGSGRDRDLPEEIETDIDVELMRNGWNERASTIVLDPELEIWIWSGSPLVDQICGWKNRIPPLRDWLIDEGYLESKHAKPSRPKEAFRSALRHVRKQPSASLFKQMAERMSFRNCTDRAFLKLTNALQTWFPIQSSSS